MTRGKSLSCQSTMWSDEPTMNDQAPERLGKLSRCRSSGNHSGGVGSGMRLTTDRRAAPGDASLPAAKVWLWPAPAARFIYGDRCRRWATQTDQACSGKTLVLSFRGSAAGRAPNPPAPSLRGVAGLSRPPRLVLLCAFKCEVAGTSPVTALVK